MTRLHELQQMGQSTWLNYMRRSTLQSGDLRHWLEEGIQGITANAALFERTLIACTDYDEAIRREVAAGTPIRRIHESLMSNDAQMAADLFHSVFQESDGLDGFVSQELDPALTHNVTQTVAEVRHLAATSDRTNIMVEVPATTAGLAAVTALIGNVQSVNITHIFSVAVYERAAQAYIAGLEYLFERHSMWRIVPKAVASFSVSAIDSAVDEELRRLGHPELAGQTAVALAKLLYERYRQIFSGPRWQKLARRGAYPLRPKWTRTTPRNFNYPDTYYVDALIGPDSVTTFSPATLVAFLDHGTVAPTLTENVDDARAHLDRLAACGLDLDTITEKLQRDYLIASEKQFQAILQCMSVKRDELERHWQTLETALGSYQSDVDKGMQALARAETMRRIWAHDYTVWSEEPEEINQRLGWLYVTAVMQENLGRLQQFAEAVMAAGFTQAVVIGGAPSNRAAMMYAETFGRPRSAPYLPFPHLDLSFVDPSEVEVPEKLDGLMDLGKTLFILASKSGETETGKAMFDHVRNRLAAGKAAEAVGSHFCAITDPGTPLAEFARQHNFRDIFLNDKNMGDRYGALSYVGLVPAALAGTELTTLLERAVAMAVNTETNAPEMFEQNLGAALGVSLGRLALDGRKKVTIWSSAALSDLGEWVAQLLLDTLGDDGYGIAPVVEDPEAPAGSYAADRLFIHLRLQNDTSHDQAAVELTAAGQPLVVLHLKDLYDVGAQIFLWQMATAVAGHLLQLNPFDESGRKEPDPYTRRLVAA